MNEVGPQRWWRARWSEFARNSATAKAQVFRALKPFLTGGVGLPSQESVAKHLDMPIDTLRSHLSRLRARYREIVLASLKNYMSDIWDRLRRILAATC